MEAPFPSAGDLLSLWNADKQGAEGLRNSGAGFEDVLNGLHNNMVAAPTPFAQTAGQAGTQQQQGQRPVQPSPQHSRHPSSSAVTHIQAAMSCDIELLDVAELPSNPPEDQQPQHAPVIPPPVNLSQADMAGFHYAEPTYFAAGMGMPGMMGHAFHHGLAMHPALAHQQAQLHAAMHPGLAAWQQPLLGNPAIVLTRPGMQLPPHPAAAAAAAAAQQQQVAAAQAAAQQQAAAAAQAAAAKAAAQQQQSAGVPARAGSGGATDSGASGALDRPGSPSFLQAALAILKNNEAQGARSGAARSGADSAGGNKSSSSGAGGAGTPRSALPLGTVGAGTPFGLAPGLQVAGMQQFVGVVPAGVTGQQLGGKALGGVSDGCSLPDDDEDYSDDQGVTPRGGSGDAGKAGAQGGSRKGQARPRSNINFDALVDPSLPPDEARRMRRMLSNRESARRSRRRRQTHLSELESQVEQLKTEKEALASELSSTSQQMRAVVAEKQRLQLEVEALRRKLSHMAPAGLEASQPELTAATLLQQPQQASGPFSALPPQPQPQQPVVQEMSERHEQGADDLLQSEWGRFGVALGGFTRPAVEAAASQQAQQEQAGGRTSLDGGRKLTRPASLHRIPSMEQMCKKVKDTGGVCGPMGDPCPTQQLVHAHSPPTVLEGLPDDLLAGTPSFGL